MRPAKVKAYERRKDIRIPIQLKVDIQSPNEHFLFESSTNLSENGIFISTEDPLEPGTRVNMQFALDEECQVQTQGEVMWVNYESDEELDRGMGIKFISLSLNDRNKILNVLKRLAIL